MGNIIANINQIKMEDKEENKNLKLYPARNSSEINILYYSDSDISKPIIEKCTSNNFNLYQFNASIQPNQLISSITKLKPLNFSIILISLNSDKDSSESYTSIVSALRNMDKRIFIVILSEIAAGDPILRISYFDAGANMVSSCLNSFEDILKKIYLIQCDSNRKNMKSSITCPICGLANLSEDSMWIHLPLYHINHNPELMENIKLCPLCKKSCSQNLQVHYHNDHGPGGRGEITSDFQSPVELYAFALVVVHRKRDNKFLLVQEFAQSGYWLPGGRVDRGEDLVEAAERETKEEGGVDIDIKGILTVQFNHSRGRLRIIYYAEPKDEAQLPKTIPDYESVGACYVHFEEIENLPLRGIEPIEWIGYVANGGAIFPLSVFSSE